jgi:predicted NBD/HSP70 family sugar kinase
MASLERLRLIVAEERPEPTLGSGRPASWYRFRGEAAAIAGIDVGNETTRAALAAADGRIVLSASTPTIEVVHDLAGSIAGLIRQLQSRVPGALGPLVGLCVGVSATVDPGTGRIRRAAIHREWDGLALQETLESRLGCRVGVEQDDHLAARAEISEHGAASGARSLVVVNFGKGIGAGYIIDGQMVRGSHGAAGRLISWPVGAGVTTGDMLGSDEMVRTYVHRGGTGQVQDGRSLCEAARRGDPVAAAVIRQAADLLGDIFLRLASSLDPEVMVLGGGFAGSFDLFAPGIRHRLLSLPQRIELRSTSLGDDAVVLGGLVESFQFVDDWLADQVAAA